MGRPSALQAQWLFGVRPVCPAPWAGRGQSSCREGENIHRALELAGDGSEMNLDGGFGKTSPSYSAQAIASLPCPEDLLDPAAHAMDRLIPLAELLQRFLLVAAPRASGDDPGNAALCTNGIAKVIATTGAVGKPPAGVIGACFRACLAVIDILLADVTETSSTNAVSASAPACALKP